MRIQKFEVVESTNDLARKYILEGNKEPAAFVAEHQTRGKGRLGRVWEDEPGKSLLVSSLCRVVPTVIHLCLGLLLPFLWESIWIYSLCHGKPSGPMTY